MFYAKAMYKGGEIVSAINPHLNYSSYLKDGLRCLMCGEEVYFRKGTQRKPHFAHFHALTDREYDCSLRVSEDPETWKHLTYQGKEQRRELFKQYFLSIVIKKYPDFKFSSSEKITESIHDLQELVQETQTVFQNKKYLFRITLNPNNIQVENIINYLIAIEALDYLSTTSNLTILSSFILYSINGLLEKDYNLTLMQKKEINHIESKNIIEFIEMLLFNIDWVNCLENTFNHKVENQLQFIKQEGIGEKNDQDKKINSLLWYLLKEPYESSLFFEINLINRVTLKYIVQLHEKTIIFKTFSRNSKTHHIGSINEIQLTSTNQEILIILQLFDSELLNSDNLQQNNIKVYQTIIYQFGKLINFKLKDSFKKDYKVRLKLHCQEWLKKQIVINYEREKEREKFKNDQKNRRLNSLYRT